MNLLDAVYQRISRRQYLPAIINAEKVETFLALIDQYNRESGLSISFIADGGEAFNGLQKSYGMFTGVRSLFVLKGDTEDAHTEEKAGFFGEYLVLEATRIGLGTCWVGASFDKKSKIFDLKENEELISVIPVGNVPDKKSFRERFIRGVSHGKLRPLEHFYTATGTVPAWFMEGIKAVQVAPSAMNRQKYKFRYANDTVEAFTEDSSKFAMIDLGIAKAHFVIATGGTFEFGDHGLYHRMESGANV